jgi:hypothetical protein
MAFDVINVGTINQGDGDTLRAGGVKINANFAKAVEGPASATDNQVALFNGTSGKLIKVPGIDVFVINHQFGGENIEINRLGNGDRNAILDFHAAGTPASVDFHARIIRGAGVNNVFSIENTGTGAVDVIANTGGVTLANGATSWAASSDERKKDIIEPISDATNKINTLRAVIGKYHWDEDDKRRSFLIAQDVQAVFPEAVSVDANNDGELLLRYTDLIPVLVAAVQELSAQVVELRAEVLALQTNG